MTLKRFSEGVQLRVEKFAGEKDPKNISPSDLAHQDRAAPEKGLGWLRGCWLASNLLAEDPMFAIFLSKPLSVIGFKHLNT